jgi:hypothetical protein
MILDLILFRYKHKNKIIYEYLGFFFKALFRIGVDQRIVNKQGKTASDYLEDNPQLIALYEGYGDGIWSAVETSNIPETERLVKGK